MLTDTILKTNPAKSNLSIPFYLSRVSAGFPNPADDYLERKLDLNEHLITHPVATFFVKVQGDSMQDAGIYNGDLLIVDRAIETQNGSIVVAIINGEFTVKTFKKIGQNIFLKPENPQYPWIEIKEEDDFEVWGTVIHAIKSF